MERLSALAHRYPARELEIHRLRARDADFRRICEDYEVAVKACRHWERDGNNPDRTAEYRQIADEIIVEIVARLDDEPRSPTGPGEKAVGQSGALAHPVATRRKLQQEQER